VGEYILRRLAVSVPVLVMITALIFILLELAPGDPLAAMLAPARGVVAPSKEYVEELRKEYGLDRPAPVRYLIWLGQVARGNLGASVTTSRPVVREIRDRLPATLELMVVSTLLAIALGVTLGVYSALHQYSILDYILMALSFTWVCVPAFFFALLVIFLFAIHLNWLPAGGLRTPGIESLTLLDNLKHLILPVFVLTMANLAEYVRFTRASVLDVMQSDFATVARAKGLRVHTIIYRHILRNALIPIVTRVGLSVAWLFSGALIVETVFRWPGLGVLMLQGVMTRDYPLILGMNLFIAVTVLVSNLVTDIAYAFVDPRIRYT
jgi:peptide/nickel transport system permease protein